MSQIEKVLYTATTHTTGGRDGASRSSDGRLDVKLSSPGAAGGGTNPEQLFAAGWSACFIGAMGVAARKMKVAMPADAAGVRATTVLREMLSGPAAYPIVREARKQGADLIVMGTHGRRGVRRPVLGSDAEQVVRTASVPVLLVRA